MLSVEARAKLERELFLSKGGGIYYDGARVDADPKSATLFVGLGGTGADMLIRIKNEVKRRMVLPRNQHGRIISDTPRNIGFLALDTDLNTKNKTWGIAAFDIFGSEFCSLAVNDMPAVIVKHKQDAELGNPIWKWYDRIDPVAGLDGAGGVRQIGRLMLFENIESVWKTVESKIKSIKGNLNRLNIIVCTGIAGGTGSGTFLDMAFILRQIARDSQVTNLRTLGYIVLPEVNLLRGGEEGKLLTNGFACLKELDYWMCPDDDQQRDRYEQQYSSNRRVRTITSRPFDFCHLLSSKDLNDVDIDYDSVISSMAENIFAYIANEVSAGTSGNSTMGQTYDNIDGYINDLLRTAPMPACYRYLAVGTQKIEIPYEEISTLLAARLFENIAPILAQRPDKLKFEQDMKRIQLIPKHLVNQSLMEDVVESPLSNAKKYPYDSIWGDSNTGAKSNKAYRDVYKWVSDSQTAIETKSAPNFPDVKNGIFLDFAKSIIKDAERGPCYLAYFLKSSTEYSVIPRLEAMATRCADIASECAFKEDGLESEMEAAYSRGPVLSVRLIKQGEIRADYLAALQRWADNDISKNVYAFRAKAIRELCERFKKYYDNVLSKLSDVLEALPAIFEKNLEYIELERQKAERLGRLDSSKLIWPQDFERERKADFMQLLADARNSFFNDLSLNLKSWVGADLDDFTTSSNSASDIPGFISQFVSRNFGSLLQIDMEEIIMRSKLSGALTLKDYIHSEFLRLREESVPMFSLRQAYKSSMADFGIVSVPDNCQSIVAECERLVQNKESVKKSKENTRFYFVKVVSGIPLYSYGQIENMEQKYESSMSQMITSRGTHLNWDWFELYPSPLFEGAWTPEVYVNARVRDFNESVRRAFDVCVSQNIVRNEGGQYALLGLKTPFDWKSVRFKGEISDDLEELESIKSGLWSESNTERVTLSGLGNYGNLSGDTALINIRESILRLPRVNREILKQAGLVGAFIEKKNEIEGPRFFAYALLCGLVVRRGFEIIFKQSASSMTGERLYDTTLDQSFGEYTAYRAFYGLMDDERREAVDAIRRGLLTRVADGGEKEKGEAIARADEAAVKYSAVIPKIEERVHEVSLDKRDALRDVLYFYKTVSRICVEYRDNYLRT